MKSTPKAVDTKGTKSEDLSTGSVDFTTKMVECMRVTGKKTEWLVTANYTINLINSPTKDIGKTINSMAKASSTTNVHNP